ncbi:MAG: hypothetical protein ACTSQO_01205, partial [Candidatus Helarchaeota archaeon]
FDGRVMQNSPQGKVPRTLWEAFIQFWQDVIKLLYNVLVAIANFIMYLVQTLIEWGLALIGMFQEAAKAIEAAVKAIILMLAYILLAIGLLIYSISSLAILSLVALLSIPLNFTFEWQFFYTKIMLNTNSFIKFNFEIYYKYYNIIDLELPVQRYNVKYYGQQKINFIFETSLIVPLNFTYNIFSDDPLMSKNMGVNEIEVENTDKQKDFSSVPPNITVRDCIVPSEWVANLAFTAQFDFLDVSSSLNNESYNEGWENYSKLYRYRIKITRLSSPTMEQYIAGVGGDWDEVWQECPRWPPAYEYLARNGIYDTDLSQEITFPDCGLYNITLEIKDNDNLTDQHSWTVRVYPNIWHFSGGFLTATITSTAMYAIYANFLKTNSILKAASTIILNIVLIIGVALISYIIYTLMSVNYNNFAFDNYWGFLLGLGYGYLGMGLNIALISLFENQYLDIFSTGVITCFYTSRLLKIIPIIKVYYNNLGEFSSFLRTITFILILHSAQSLIIYLNNKWITGENKYWNLIGFYLGFEYLLIGLFFIFLSVDYLQLN